MKEQREGFFVMNDHGFSTGFTGFLVLIGVGLGAGAAYLLMPQPGSGTREQLRGYARRTEENVHEAANEVTQVLEKAVEGGVGF